jgi:hypothetical protein
MRSIVRNAVHSFALVVPVMFLVAETAGKFHP